MICPSQAKLGEVSAQRTEGVLGHRIAVAYDPSVAV
jgi:hypothetical protein